MELYKLLYFNHSIFRLVIMSYIHKSGAQKRQEKRVKDGESMKGLQTLFQVGIHRPAENSSKLIEGVLDEIIVDAMDIVENNEVSEYNSEVVAICEFEETQVRHGSFKLTCFKERD